MKKKFKALVLTVFIGGAVLFAQNRDAQQMINKKVDHMAKELNLTQEQRDEVYAIHMKYADRMEATRASKEGRAAKQEDRLALRKAINKDLSQVLTADQMKQVESFRKNKRAHAHKKFDGKGKHMEHMTKALDLTEEQQKALRKVHKRHMEKVKAVRVMDISDADKKARKKELKAEMRKSYKNILTKEQFKKFKAMRKVEHRNDAKNWAEPAK